MTQELPLGCDALCVWCGKGIESDEAPICDECLEFDEECRKENGDEYEDYGDIQ